MRKSFEKPEKQTVAKEKETIKNATVHLKILWFIKYIFYKIFNDRHKMGLV
jgi:hypothetical protein